MIFSRSTFGESPSPSQSTKSAADKAPPPSSHRDTDLHTAQPPRWGLLAAAVLAALVTAAWIGSAFSTAQAAAAPTTSAQPSGK